ALGTPTIRRPWIETTLCLMVVAGGLGALALSGWSDWPRQVPRRQPLQPAALQPPPRLRVPRPAVPCLICLSPFVSSSLSLGFLTRPSGGDIDVAPLRSRRQSGAAVAPRQHGGSR